MAATIGYIGVGDMGGPMVRNMMTAGFDVVVYDTQADRMDALVADGAQRGGSAADVANRAEIVMVCLNTLGAVRSVATEAATGSAIKIYVDMSTTGPTPAQELRRIFDGTGIATLDAPVSGHISKAVDGTLTVIASGPRDAFDTCKPAFEAMGENVFYLGDIPGGGQMMKLANNYVNNVQAVGTSEALTMGIKFGLDPSVMLDILNVSTGRNSQTQGPLAEAVRTGKFLGGANMKISQKDISLAVEEAQRLGAPTDMGVAAKAAYDNAIANGGDRDRSTAIMKHVAARAGLTVEKA
ncbi:MAG: NAD(P)-dependent oxidoreductase [Proteobacteria bacterium]|nr:NAD(P)-dependent oxidoreductase [Pseudomonadota bacterium]